MSSSLSLSVSPMINDNLVPHIKELHTVFLHSLGNSSSAEVNIAALNDVINFIEYLTSLGSSNDRERKGRGGADLTVEVEAGLWWWVDGRSLRVGSSVQFALPLLRYLLVLL
ncbi:hypothetical protein GBA52_014753 [Prunus armeniaca]|nr:hypothetical protein GBA52_014753 [Prunus armeniaca]